MGRFASDSGNGNFTQAPTGTHVARCVKIIDLGTQHGEYNNQPTRRNQVLVVWELPKEIVDEKPVTASAFYTNSLGKNANLRRDLELWRGRGFTQDELDRFDLQAILGAPCLLTVIPKGEDKTKVGGVSGLPKGMECPPQITPSFAFWLDEFTPERFNELSTGIQDIIKRSEEFPQIVNGGKTPNGTANSADEQVPF